MSYPSRGADHYLQTQVRSSSPLELVVMLYDGALRATSAAADALVRKDIPARRSAISKAMGLISELQGTLDMEKGGQIALELDRLYTWMTDQLLSATVKQDAAPIHQVHKVLSNLRGAWHEIATRPPAQVNGGTAATAPESAA